MELAEEYEKEIEKQEKVKTHPKLPHNLKGAKIDMVRSLVGTGLFGVGVAISAVPTLILLPICIVPTIILAVVGVALFMYELMADGDEDKGGFSGLILLLPVMGAGVVGLVCLAPALLPAGIGIVLNKIISPNDV